MMQLFEKTKEKIVFETDMDIGLANAIRRSVNEIVILAIDEVDIYKNDSALYDEIIAHRLGLVPLENQRLKEGKELVFKLKAKGSGSGSVVVSGALGKGIIHDDMPIVLLEKDQEIELVAKARVGKGKEHAKFVPGLVYYKHMPKITIAKEGEKNEELAKIYPGVFEFNEKLKVKDEWKANFDEEDMENYKGVEIKFTDNLVFFIESWGQIEAKEIFIESCKTLKENLKELSKEI